MISLAPHRCQRSHRWISWSWPRISKEKARWAVSSCCSRGRERERKKSAKLQWEIFNHPGTKTLKLVTERTLLVYLYPYKTFKCLPSGELRSRQRNGGPNSVQSAFTNWQDVILVLLLGSLKCPDGRHKLEQLSIWVSQTSLSQAINAYLTTMSINFSAINIKTHSMTYTAALIKWNWDFIGFFGRNNQHLRNNLRLKNTMIWKFWRIGSYSVFS